MPDRSRAAEPFCRFDALDRLMHSVIDAARVPGVAMAVVIDGVLRYRKGFGYRDLHARKPMTAQTLYPIASTTKAINAALLATLVEEGKLDWDAPVQRYLPGFRLRESPVSRAVSLRDLVTMRTGLPRHDWAWIGDTTSRSALVDRLAHLAPSAEFRQRFQYCNLTVTASGHIAEVVTGQSWETLVRARLLRPLGMRRTVFGQPRSANVTRSYHEDPHRNLVRSPRLATEATAPSGGSIFSTVSEMARWIAFNLGDGAVRGQRILTARTLGQLHAPQIVIGDHSLAPLPSEASYAFGWVVHSYRGERCISHGGYLRNVNSSVMLFPDRGIGLVSVVNFGAATLAEFLNLRAYDALLGLAPAETLEQKLARYETQIRRNQARLAAAARARVRRMRPSHALSDYAGRYTHPGYGEVRIRLRRGRLAFGRASFEIPLEHWHYDCWMADRNPLSTQHAAHPFDAASPIQFHMSPSGDISAFSMRLEPEVAPIRFERAARRFGRRV